MSISHYSYKYGHGSKEFSLESDRVIKEVTVAKMPLLEDVKAAILDAVYHPIGSAPINELVKPGQKIAFICNDPTRVANSFVFMPILVNEMNKLGIKDEDMHIVFALGTHRNMTHEEMVEAVGAEVAGRLKMYNSDAKVSEDFEYFGDTSRGTPVWLNKHICHVDHVIMTGTIVHHYFSGYGGKPFCRVLQLWKPYVSTTALCWILMQVWVKLSAILFMKTKWKVWPCLPKTIPYFFLMRS